jgi:hypothetical protein
MPKRSLPDQKEFNRLNLAVERLLGRSAEGGLRQTVENCG